MSIESDNPPEIDLFSCPFIETCDLPKHHFICRISGFKACSEYTAKVNKLKTHRMLY